jgi:hypothetical protein
MSETEELKPCPWPECEGNADVKSDMPPFFVQCRACECQGPHCETEDEARSAWNNFPCRPAGADPEVVFAILNKHMTHSHAKVVSQEIARAFNPIPADVPRPELRCQNVYGVCDQTPPCRKFCATRGKGLPSASG